MHELSIVHCLLGLIGEHMPSGARVHRVRVCAGPLRAVEPDAMQWAWIAATDGSEHEGATLEVQLLPWKIHCRACDRRWDSQDPLEACACGYPAPSPVGSDELTLVCLEVEDQQAGDGGEGRTLRGTCRKG